MASPGAEELETRRPMAQPTEGQASGKVGAKVLFIARQQDEVVGAYPPDTRWGAGLGLGTDTPLGCWAGGRYGGRTG